MSDRAAEAVLAAALATGDEAAFASIYEAFSTRVFNLVLRSVRDRGLAEDLCQEIWLKVHREAHNLRAPDAFAVWLYRLAARACIDWARSRHREANSELPEDLIDQASSEPEATTVRRSEARLAWQALAALPPRQSMALYLKQLEGCDYKQIARILDCSESTVESLLFRARRGLARVYHDMETSQRERCTSIRQVMAAVLDGEANGVQKRGMELHLEECINCRLEMSGMRRAVAGYAALPLVPLSGSLLPGILAATAPAAQTGSSLAQVIGLFALKVKTGLLIAAIGGAVATTTVTAAAIAGFDVGPADALGDVLASVVDVPAQNLRAGDASDAQSPGSAPGYYATPAPQTSGSLNPLAVPYTAPGPGLGQGGTADLAPAIPSAVPMESGLASRADLPIAADSGGSSVLPLVEPVLPTLPAATTELLNAVLETVPDAKPLLESVLTDVPKTLPGVTSLPGQTVPLPPLTQALPSLPTAVVPKPVVAVPAAPSAASSVSLPAPTVVVPKMPLSLPTLATPPVFPLLLPVASPSAPTILPTPLLPPSIPPTPVVPRLPLLP